jgi:hypothetical protein
MIKIKICLLKIWIFHGYVSLFLQVAGFNLKHTIQMGIIIQILLWLIATTTTIPTIPIVRHYPHQTFLRNPHLCRSQPRSNVG